MSQTQVLNQGRVQLLRAIINDTPVKISAVRVSSDYGFTPPLDITAIQNLVYTQDATCIDPIKYGNTIRYAVTIPKTETNIVIGSIVLYVDGDLGTVPLLYHVMDEPSNKDANDEYSINVGFTLSDSQDAEPSTIIPIEYGQLNATQDESPFPTNMQLDVALSLFYKSETGEFDDWYINWMFQEHSDPLLGCLDGGHVGDGFQSVVAEV